jgi:hypothetical protein
LDKTGPEREVCGRIRTFHEMKRETQSIRKKRKKKEEKQMETYLGQRERFVEG